ncbi:hypothetical protein OG735_39355 [Streptomyces sp. NBC_01210]|nr:hypothetical protein OG735_39355 [Streptomyces sp. NBC_01210]
MTTGAHPNAPALRANIALARDCAECRGWGSVVNDGRYELCPACQTLGA